MQRLHAGAFTVESGSNAKIDNGVIDCLEQCRGSTSPWTTAAFFIDGLKQSPDWADAEIIELQTLVIRALLREPTAKPA